MANFNIKIRAAIRLLLVVMVFQLSTVFQTSSSLLAAAATQEDDSSSSSSSSSSPSSSIESAASSSALSSGSDASSSSQAVCKVKGRVYTQRKWYGYLVHKAFHQNYAKIEYQITYPVRECCADLLIYYDDQVKELQAGMTCEERKGVLPADNNQVIPLREENEGCTIWDEKGESFYICRGERIFRSRLSRTWFFALSRCDQTGPLNVNYIFNITGYYGECEEDPLAPSSGWNSYVGYLGDKRHSKSDQSVYKYLSISLGIVAGLALILAAVFFGLWFLGLRNAAKGKGSSVTSSQATMTQDDIFYVNPSLSDQGHQEYSQSGSENYYEVIPERRSYESINAGLANGGMHLKPIRGPLHGGSLAHHPHHGGHHHPLHPHAHHAAHHPHGIHHPHALNMAALNHGAGGTGGGLHHTAGRPTQVKDLGQNVRGVTYMFDYPPPPYQPPKLGMGKSPSGGVAISSASSPHNQNMLIGNNSGPSSAGNFSTPSGSMAHHHQHTLSLPANHQRQQQRQHFVPAHHAYHSSIVPTSSALGLEDNNTAATTSGNLVGAGTGSGTTGLGYNNASSGSGMINLNTMGNNPVSTTGGSSFINPGVMSSLSEVGGYRPETVPITSGGLSMSNGGQGLNLGTFGIGSGGNNSSNSNGIGINSGVGGGNNPVSSIAMSLNSTSGSSQVPPPAPNGGQCETSA